MDSCTLAGLHKRNIDTLLPFFGTCQENENRTRGAFKIWDGTLRISSTMSAELARADLRKAKKEASLTSSAPVAQKSQRS
jgi:hypothetical protein